MFCKVMSGALLGMECYLVTVEVDISNGLPCMELVGFLSSEVREAKERVKVAMHNCGISFPGKRITVNLSPANVRKAGSSFDLPIAVGILGAMGRVKEIWQNHVLYLGELGLDGSIRRVNGILPIVLEAKEKGMKLCVIPKENEKEGRLVEGIGILGVRHLKEVIRVVEEETASFTEYERNGEGRKEERNEKPETDFLEVKGQEIVKRAVMVATAGFHHLLMMGVPGVGKTMIAKRIPGILPPLSMEECLEVSKVYSISGALKEGQLIDRPPYVSPHHSITMQALAGGGKVPVPGALSLAHKGVLFLDEMTEFKRATLDSMRQPLEEKKVQIARNAGTFTYPADFMLVGAMNLCPCGYYPDMGKCSCSQYERRRYLSRVSGPLLDRMDVCVAVEPPDIGEIVEGKREKGMSTARMADQVKRAREIQKIRYKEEQMLFNSQLKGKQFHKYCRLEEKVEKLLQEMFEKRQLSPRAYYRVLKVSRTIADLEESHSIKEEHVVEALSYSTPLDMFR